MEHSHPAHNSKGVIMSSHTVPLDGPVEQNLESMMMQTVNGNIGTKNVTINESTDNMGDVQAGIEFIYHMREHLIDVGVATAYLFVCYTIYLLLKKYIK